MRINSSSVRGMLSLFIMCALQAWSVAGQGVCEGITECDTCTSGGAAAVNKCVWCLNNNPLDGGSLKDTPALKAGRCAVTCPDSGVATNEQTTGALGIVETVTTKTKTDGSDAETFVGIDTVREDVKLRRGTTATFTVKLTKGPVPFQLYFLLDLSDSMSNILDAVKRSARDLPFTFENDSDLIKPEFEFGFGSFIDKSIPPFTYDRFDFAVPTYGFRHAVTFTSAADPFRNGIEDVTVSGNNDQPEGGMDAVVQALYCEDLIGWKNLDTNALRLILMTTDDTSHVAGDGIEAGLLWPHELKCQNQFYFGTNDLSVPQLMNPVLRSETECKNENGKDCWYHNVVHDYPSVDQIAQGLRDRKTSLAFVVPASGDQNYPGRFEHYKAMVDKSLGSLGVVATDPLQNNANLQFNSIVRNTYYQIIQLTPEFTAIEGGDPEFDDFYTVSSICKVTTDNPKSVTVNGVPAGVNIVIDLKFDCDFQVDLRGAAGSPKKLTQIQSQGTFGDFEVVVESSDCFCPAPAPVNLYFPVPINRNKCSNQGITSETKCGECICEAGATGDVCACTEENKFAQCPTAEISGLKCNGVGTCECGKCKCPPPYYGSACECSDQCDEPVDELRCGGPDAGTCVCETCQCKPGYSGAKCECNNNKCDPPGGAPRCNGRSKTQLPTEAEGEGCNCGVCDCKPPYSGEFCEICDAVLGAQLNPQVLCGDDGKCGACTRTPSDDAEPDDDTWGCECCFGIGDSDGSDSLCQWCFESNQCISRETLTKAQNANPKETVCTAGFTTITNADNVTTEELFYAVFDNITQCPPPEPADVTAIVTGTLLGLLALIILALLLWRLLAFLNDKKEWENYEKDKARSKWQADNNPIFQSSVAEFENPIFE